MFAMMRFYSDNNVGCSAFVCDYDEVIEKPDNYLK